MLLARPQVSRKPFCGGKKMGYRYFLCDVFTDTRFGGNPLAVLPAATGLSDRQMQKIAREFNFSETTFVFPAEEGHTRRVRIFTPTKEVPFAFARRAGQPSAARLGVATRPGSGRGIMVHGAQHQSADSLGGATAP